MLWSRHSAKLGTLPSARTMALGKDFLKKKIKIFLPSTGHVTTRRRFKKNRKTLPSVGHVTARQRRRQTGLSVDGDFSVPSVDVALGKGFAECPIYCTRQRTLCRQKLCRRVFAECNTRQTLCRVQTWVCRVFRALGKEPVSSSATKQAKHQKSRTNQRWASVMSLVLIEDIALFGSPLT